jgi:transcriptional regulator with XRE-family HTH domain
MKINDLLDRIANLKQTASPGDILVPPPELIAFNVRMTRRLMNLKKSALAHLAGVSLSTVERVENAESVSPECLDKIAAAFGEQPGYFTAPRPLQPHDKAATEFSEKFGRLEAVPVRHLNTQAQVRALAGCHSFVVNAPELDDLKEDIRGLVEWLDLAAFVVSPLTHSDGDEGGRRRLYADVLTAVANLEKQGVTVLAGIMPHPQHGIDDWKIAVINVTRKSMDPGAINRKFVLVDTRAITQSRVHSAN